MGRHGVRRLRMATGSAVSVVASLLALNLVLAGETAARESATQSSAANSFTAATVTLTDTGSPTCTVSGLQPDGVVHTCPTFTATYAGTGAAYLALDVLIETQAGVGGAKLYNPANGINDLQVAVTSASPSATYTIPTVQTACPAAAPANSLCYELDDEVVSTSPATSASVTFTTTVTLPTTTVAGTQGGAAQITLTTHAVGAANNTLPPSCVTAGAGTSCPATTNFHWN